jgi:hypothetical protein
MEQDGAAAPSSVAAVSVFADPSNPTTSFSDISSNGASAREQQLIAQVQSLQQQIAELRGQAHLTAA